MKTKFLTLVACGLPIVAAAFGMHFENDQTRPGPGGSYGIYQYIRRSSNQPDDNSSYVCSGGVAVRVPTIKGEVKHAKSTGLRELWALSNYRSNSLPSVWLPNKLPPPTQDVEAFRNFSPGKDGFLIREFIGRFGLSSRYLSGQWNKGEVRTFKGSFPFKSDETLQGPDFLIYDLPSGHAVALYVPKPPADRFITAIIIDSKGDLLIPNMVELLLPHSRVVAPRRIIAESNGQVTATDASGGKETIGTWTTKNGQLVIRTISTNGEAVRSQDRIWLGEVEYVSTIKSIPDPTSKENVIICSPLPGRAGTSQSEK